MQYVMSAPAPDHCAVILYLPEGLLIKKDGAGAVYLPDIQHQVGLSCLAFCHKGKADAEK